ncbi:Hypothetical protein GLP15_1985 [Giardia lamblia P15]|uniref:Uncharacterized protein n=1 Tax=Giardia intestinalis (strain P15) TaxID=658858 RepID=E1F145_GIAIA|nr:Hypothetical protein GLP15_1985 [Giardia lamblia P15]
MNKPLNFFCQTPKNEFAPEDLGMVHAFFESSKFKKQDLHQRYIEQCQPRSHSISARTTALRALLEPQQGQPLNNVAHNTTFNSDKLSQQALVVSSTPCTLPRRRTIKRKHRSLRLTIEKMKRNLIKQNLAKQIHKQSFRSTETIMTSALGLSPQTPIGTADETPGVHVLPKGIQTEEYEIWRRAEEDLIKLIEADKGFVRHFTGQTMLVLMKFPILLSSRIKAKLQATGGILVFSRSNAAVFCTIFDTPLNFRKFTINLSKMCSSEYHQFTTIFAGNRYLVSVSFNSRLNFVALQQKKLEEQTIYTTLRLDPSLSVNRVVVVSIKEAITLAFDGH